MSSKYTAKTLHRTTYTNNGSCHDSPKKLTKSEEFSESIDQIRNVTASRTEVFRRSSMTHSEASTIKQCQYIEYLNTAKDLRMGEDNVDNPFQTNENNYPPLKYSFTPLFNSNITATTSIAEPLDKGGISKQMTFGSSSFRNSHSEELKNDHIPKQVVVSSIPEASESLECTLAQRGSNERIKLKQEGHNNDSTAADVNKMKKVGIIRKVENLDNAQRGIVFKNLLMISAKGNIDSTTRRLNGAVLSTRMEDLERNFFGGNKELKEKKEDVTISQLSIIRPRDNSSLMINNLGKSYFIFLELSMLKFNDTGRDTSTPKVTRLMNSENSGKLKCEDAKSSIESHTVRYITLETIAMY